MVTRLPFRRGRRRFWWRRSVRRRSLMSPSVSVFIPLTLPFLCGSFPIQRLPSWNFPILAVILWPRTQSVMIPFQRTPVRGTCACRRKAIVSPSKPGRIMNPKTLILIVIVLLTRSAAWSGDRRRPWCGSRIMSGRSRLLKFGRMSIRLTFMVPVPFLVWRTLSVLTVRSFTPRVVLRIRLVVRRRVRVLLLVTSALIPGSQLTFILRSTFRRQSQIILVVMRTLILVTRGGVVPFLTVLGDGRRPCGIRLIGERRPLKIPLMRFVRLTAVIPLTVPELPSFLRGLTLTFIQQWRTPVTFCVSGVLGSSRVAACLNWQTRTVLGTVTWVLPEKILTFSSVKITLIGLPTFILPVSAIFILTWVIMILIIPVILPRRRLTFLTGWLVLPRLNLMI